MCENHFGKVLLKYNQHKPVLTSIHEFCPNFVCFNPRKNYIIIIIMS